MKKQLKSYLLITLGAVLMAAGVYFFKFPNNFSTGGVSGLSILLAKLMPFTTPAVIMAVINVLLLVLGFIVFGKSFGIKTVYTSLLFTGLTFLLEQIVPLSAPLTDQPLLELFFAIVLSGVGAALMFNQNASSGGTDIVAMILKKFTSLDIGKSLLVTDLLIAASALIVFDIRTGLFSLFGLLLKAFIIDGVIENINLCKYFAIVTTKPEEVCKYIIDALHHSATVIDAVGAYSDEDRKVVLVACKRGEALHLRQRVRELDEHAFMFITNTSEIIGKGFRTVL